MIPLEALPAILLVALVVAMILLKVPVPFAMICGSLITALIFQGWPGVYQSAQALYRVMINWALLAVPLFVFIAAMIEKTGMAEELFTGFYKIIGSIRGSLAIICILMGYVMGAMTGVFTGILVVLSYLLFRPMVKLNYPKHLAIFSILIGGTLAQIVPPTVNGIVYGLSAGVSVIRLFAGSLGAGTLLTLLSIAYVFIYAQTHKDIVPKLEVKLPLTEKVKALKDLLPCLVIIISILGSMYAGVASPTEAAGIGAFITLIYNLLRRRLSKKIFIEICLDTLRISAMICWIIAAGTFFGTVFSLIGGKAYSEAALAYVAEHFGKYALYMLACMILLFLGMIMDNVTIIVIAAPILAEPMMRAGFDPIFWGVIFCLMLIAGFFSPPVAMAVFVTKAALGDEVQMEEVYKSAIHALIITLASVAIITLIPDIVLFPVKLFFGS